MDATEVSRMYCLSMPLEHPISAALLQGNDVKMGNLLELGWRPSGSDLWGWDASRIRTAGGTAVY